MIRRTASLLALAVAILFASVCRADKPVKLQFRMKKGDRLIYRSTTRVKKTETVKTMKVKTEIDADTIVVRTLDKIDAKGNIHLETVYKRLKMKVKIGSQGEYKYDSTSMDNEKASTLGSLFTPVFDTLNQASFKVTITPQGKVLPVKGFQELLAEVVKNNPLKEQYTNKVFEMEFGETLVRLSDKPVKKGDTWEHNYTLKLPGVATIKGSAVYTHAGREKIGGRETVKITAVYGGSFDVDLKRGGAVITGTLTISEATGTIHFDPKTGHLVSKTKTARMSGTLNVDVNGMMIPVESDQTTKTKIELLEKLPD